MLQDPINNSALALKGYPVKISASSSSSSSYCYYLLLLLLLLLTLPVQNDTLLKTFKNREIVFLIIGN